MNYCGRPPKAITLESQLRFYFYILCYALCIVLCFPFVCDNHKTNIYIARANNPHLHLKVQTPLARGDTNDSIQPVYRLVRACHFLHMHPDITDHKVCLHNTSLAIPGHLRACPPTKSLVVRGLKGACNAH